MLKDCLLKRLLASVIRNYPKEKIVERLRLLAVFELDKTI
jgi:hypothetical protein